MAKDRSNKSCQATAGLETYVSPFFARGTLDEELLSTRCTFLPCYGSLTQLKFWMSKLKRQYFESERGESVRPDGRTYASVFTRETCFFQVHAVVSTHCKTAHLGRLVWVMALHSLYFSKTNMCVWVARLPGQWNSAMEMAHYTMSHGNLLKYVTETGMRPWSSAFNQLTTEKKAYHFPLFPLSSRHVMDDWHSCDSA